MPTWKFVNIIHSPQGEQSPTDPDARYRCFVSKDDGASREGTGCRYRDLELIMKSLMVDKPRKLVGRQFVSPTNYTEGPLALDYYLTQLRHGGIYMPPAPDQIYDRIVDALARMECPDFSDIDRLTLWQAMVKWYNRFNILPARLTWLQEEVQRRSGGRVEVESANAVDFAVTVHGVATFLRLITSDDRIQRFVLTPTLPPVTFDTE